MVNLCMCHKSNAQQSIIIPGIMRGQTDKIIIQNLDHLQLINV